MLRTRILNNKNELNSSQLKLNSELRRPNFNNPLYA